jgi:nucleotide-binding universal stress UspA family protein
MFRSILVPLDGSRFGEHALPYAVGVARRTGARIQVVHKHVPPAPIHPDGVLAREKKVPEDTRPRERAYLDEVAVRLQAAGVEASTALVEGPTVEALCEHAAGSGADLAVMTTHGRGPLSRFWMGSVADALMRRLTVPLLLVRPSEDEGPSLAEPPALRRVLVPLDGSEESEAVLGPAADLGADDFTLLRVVEPLPMFGMEVPLYPVQADAALSAQLTDAAHDYLAGVAGRLRGRGPAVRTRMVVYSSAAGAILDESAGGFDLVALETHGRGGLARLVLGSVADKVVRGAAIPVLVHRTPVPKAH